MNDDQMATIGIVSFFILILAFSSSGFFHMGAYFARKYAINETTIFCIENPQECKEWYEYLKLSEKLRETK